MAVTINQIAELAGVSRGTVDRALNNRGQVNQDVKKRIQEIANELGYKPNIVAKSLATSNKKSKIGVVVSAKGNDFFSDVFRGIDEASNEIKDFGFTILIENLLGFDVQKQMDAIDKLLDIGIIGLAITPIDDQRIKEKLKKLHADGLPIVAINSDIMGCDFLPYVGCDYYASGQTAGDLMGLVMRSKARVLIVTGSYKILGHNLRVKGFSDVLKNDYSDVEIVSILEGNDSNRQCFELIDDALKKMIDINAVYFAAGGANGGVKAIIENGLQNKIKVITNDATKDRMKYLKAGIIDATICQQPYEQGYLTIKMLFDHTMGVSLLKGEKRYTNIGIKMKYNF